MRTLLSIGVILATAADVSAECRAMKPGDSATIPTTGAPPAWTGPLYDGHVVWWPQGDRFTRYDPCTNAWKPVPDTGNDGAYPANGNALLVGSSVVIMQPGRSPYGSKPTLEIAVVDDKGWHLYENKNVPTLSATVFVSTGTEVLAWGGNGTDVRGDGYRFDPKTGSIRRMSATGAPSARSSPHVAWTGSKLFVWGGLTSVEASGYGLLGTAVADGALYDPATDTWTPISKTGAPTARHRGDTSWTGTRVAIRGGMSGIGGDPHVTDGALYDPATDRWERIADATKPLVAPPPAPPEPPEYRSGLLVWGAPWPVHLLPAEANHPALIERWDAGAKRWLTAKLPDTVTVNARNALWLGDRVLIWQDVQQPDRGNHGKGTGPGHPTFGLVVMPAWK